MMPGLDVIGSAVIAAFTSFIVCVMVILTQRWHGKLSLDSDVSGVQKFHTVPVPRIGGLALLLGGLAVALIAPFKPVGDTGGEQANTLLRLLLAGLPAFFAGLIEDITKKVSITGRLVATFVSALLACWLIGAVLSRVDVWGIDAVFQWSLFVAAAFTAFAVAGVANSINIIDGFHGIAGGTVIIILSGLGFLAWRQGDALVVQLAIVGIAALVGFLLVNYPTGRLFLGDGGAYLAGFWVAEVAILLIIRNPSVSAWQALAVSSYPVIEALYSIFRKKIIRKKSPALPDKLHLHMLVYRRLVCPQFPRGSTHAQPWIRNAMVACVIVPFVATMALLSIQFGGTTAGGVSVVLIQVFLYLGFYARLVRGHWCLNPVVGLGFRPEHRAKAT